MIDYIKNGVTTGGVAPVPGEPSEAANIYSNYMNQIYAERKEALDKNNQILRDFDLSKVDPKDRPYVDAEYNKWRQIALSPPNTTKRGDFNAWRAKVLQGETDLKNRINLINGTRKSIVDAMADPGYEFDAHNKLRQMANSSVIGNDGKLINPDFNSLSIKPEHAYDTDKDIGGILEKNYVKNKQLNDHRRKDGKVVNVFADQLDVNGALRDAAQRYEDNPEFKDGVDKQYAQYKALNPQSGETVDDFLEHKVRAGFPGMNDRDQKFNNAIPTNGNFMHYNVNEKDPNDYRPRINISLNSKAEKEAAYEKEYQNTMSAIGAGLRSGDPNTMLTASQIASKHFNGMRYGDKGVITGTNIVKGDDGKQYFEITAKDPSSIVALPETTRIPADDPNLPRLLHNTYNEPYVIHQPLVMRGEDSYNKALAAKNAADAEYMKNNPTQVAQPVVDDPFGVQDQPGVKTNTPLPYATPGQQQDAPQPPPKKGLMDFFKKITGKDKQSGLDNFQPTE